MPSSGGGTKLIRTLRAGDNVGDGEGVGVGVGDGDSCASTAYVDASESKIARFSFFVILLVSGAL